MSGPEINMDLKTLTANYCHSTAGGNTYTMSARLLSSPVFADPGRVWSCNINCGTCLTFQGPAGAGPWDQLCHIVMDPVWGHHSEGSSSQDHGAGVQGDQTNGPQSPVQLQVVEPLWVPSWLNAPGETVGRGRPGVRVRCAGRAGHQAGPHYQLHLHCLHPLPAQLGHFPDWQSTGRIPFSVRSNLVKPSQVFAFQIVYLIVLDPNLSVVLLSIG